MENLIQKHRAFVASQIEKSFDNNIEKAHQDGDMHPNGKWVWVSSANGGKGDWRVAGARTHKNASAGAIPSSDVKPVTAKEFSKNKNAVVEMLKNCDSKTDSNGDKRYHCEFYALGKDRGSAWLKKSDIEAYLRNYDDAKITPIKSDNASKEQKFKQSFKDASDEVLQKVVDGKIQATDEERKWAKDLINERKAAGVKDDAAKKIIDLLKVHSGKYSDIKKVKAFKTDKGNYYIDYDGADTGIVLNGNKINDRDFENAGVEVVKTKDDSATKQKSDPRDKVAQDAGFKDYAEMKGWQDYNTAKSLLKKPSTQANSKNERRVALEKMVAEYEKEHADVIKRIAEKKGAKSNSVAVKIDETTIDQAEYDSQLKQAKQVDDSARSMAKSIIQGNIVRTKKKLQETISSQPGAKATIDALQKDLTKFVSQKKAVEDAEKKDVLFKDTKSVDEVMGKTMTLQQSGEYGTDNYHSLSVKLFGGSGSVPYTFQIKEYNGNKISISNVKVKNKEGAQKILNMLKTEYGASSSSVAVGGKSDKDGKKASDSYASMDIKDAKKALVGKVVTLADYWPDGRGGSQDAIGEIKNVRLYGKNKTPIAEVVYPNGDEQMIRLDEIDDGKMKDSYKTAITIGDDKTKLDAIKKKISNNA